MKFSSVITYAIDEKFKINEADLNEALGRSSYIPCEKHESARFGFVSPFGAQNEEMYHKSSNQLLLCAKKEIRPVPAGAVNEELAKKNAKHEEANGSPLSGKEKQALKEDIIHQLQPQAFSRYEMYWAILDLERNRLMVAVSTASKAEDFNALLRSVLGSLPVKPWAPDTTDLRRRMTQWVLNCPNKFELGSEAKLLSPAEDDGVLTTRKQSLDSEELLTAIENGKVCVELGLSLTEKVSFVLTEKMQVKKLRPESETLEEYSFIDGSEAEKLDSDFAMWSLTLRELFDELERALAADEEEAA